MVAKGAPSQGRGMQRAWGVGTSPQAWRPSSKDQKACISVLQTGYGAGCMRWGDRRGPKTQPATGSQSLLSPIPKYVLMDLQGLPSASRGSPTVSPHLPGLTVLHPPHCSLSPDPERVACPRASQPWPTLFPLPCWCFASFPSRAIPMYLSRTSSVECPLYGPLAFSSLWSCQRC